MARLPTVQKEELSSQHQPIYDAIAQSRGRVQGPFTVLLHSPEVAGRVAHLGAYIRFESVLPAAVRSLAALTVARELDCQYEWTANLERAHEFGVRKEATAALRDRTAPKGLTQEETLVVGYVQQLLRSHRLSEATYREALARFGVQGLVELTATVGYYAMIAYPLNAFEVDPMPGVPLLPL